MPKFGLAGEGRTDQAVLHNILLAYFDGLEGRDIGRTQPHDKSDKNTEGSQGNWIELLKYLGSSRFLEDLQAFDYLIVQIDTDIADEKHANFIVRDEEGNRVSDIEIVNNVVEKLVERINSSKPNYFDEIKDKIIFSVTVESTECWLINVYIDNDEDICKHDIKCFDNLKELLKRTTEMKKLKKKSQHYNRASQCFYEDPSLIDTLSKRDASFKAFITQLKEIEPRIKESLG